MVKQQKSRDFLCLGKPRKRGQMLGQIFIFILAAILFVLVLTYGYRAISNFLERSEQVTLIEFKERLQSGIERIKRDYGSVRKIELQVPKKYTDVCFVDPRCPESLQFEYPVMYNACLTGTENIFLVPQQETPIFVGDIVIDSPGYICIPTSGMVTLRLEGLGRTARISPWQ